MRYIVPLTLLLLTMPVQADTVDQITAASVMVKSHDNSGSGVLVAVGDRTFVITAGHLVQNCRHEDRECDKVKHVSFDDVEVVRTPVEDGRTVGHESYYARVIRYSPPNTEGEDIAILEIRHRGYYHGKTIFATGVPKLGTPLYHVGSLLGQGGSNSITAGIVSFTGRILDERVYDQSSCVAFPGSSGGGVFRASDGSYIGMITCGAGVGFNFFVPIRRIRSYARRTKIDWLFDPETKQVPEDTGPIEEK